MNYVIIILSIIMYSLIVLKINPESADIIHQSSCNSIDDIITSILCQIISCSSDNNYNYQKLSNLDNKTLHGIIHKFMNKWKIPSDFFIGKQTNIIVDSQTLSYLISICN